MAGVLDAPDLGVLSPQPESKTFRSPTDLKSARNNIYGQVFDSFTKTPPISDSRHTLTLSNVRWADPENVPVAAHKSAIMRNETLARRLRGTWTLKDNASGDQLDEKDSVIAAVPMLTDNGTFVLNGVDNTLGFQSRLRAGAFVRRQDNGDLHVHVNALPGQGRSHHYQFDPEKLLFSLEMGGGKVPLLPVLRAMGIHDRQLRDAWGPEIFGANATARDGNAISKLYTRLVRNGDPTSTGESQSKAVVDALMATKLDPEVTGITLGHPYAHLSPEAIIESTKRLLQVSRGERDSDDRDAPVFQHVLAPEDLLAERAGQTAAIARQILWKSGFHRNLTRMPSGLMTKHLWDAITSSGVGGNAEEVNPLELLGQLTRITRMGVGGIPSSDSIPDESRALNPGHLGVIDPVLTPESSRIGVDLRLAGSAVKGKDGRLYAPLRNLKTGQVEYLSPKDMYEKRVLLPGERSSGEPYGLAVHRGRTDTIDPKQADYEPIHMEAALNPLMALVPMRSASKPHRVMMGARMQTQALALEKPEAPLVQPAVPDEPGQSYHGKYGPWAGAVRSEKGGRVSAATADRVSVTHPDGTSTTYDLRQNQPYNRKSLIHQTPVVRAGDVVPANGLVARSNYTDQNGQVAVGTNLRAAYLPDRGWNFEDAVSVSESAARDKLRSEHLYQHSADFEPGTKISRHSILGLFPSAYDKRQTEAIGDDGVIKPGTVVREGDPLVLRARQRERSHDRVARGAQAGWSNDSMTWDHTDPGVVTDVEKTDRGVLVSVKSYQSAKVGDKVAGSFGDKGIISRIIPDAEMPRDARGNPFEILLNPAGIPTRTNPSQVVEAILGKVAEHDQKPYLIGDFKQVPDLMRHAISEARRRGIPLKEDVFDPVTNIRVPRVLTGSRFIMKLHHTAECFDAETEALTSRGWVPWPDVEDDDLLATVEDGKIIYERPINVTRSSYTGDLYCFSGRYVDYAVTGNHRHYVRRYYSGAEFYFDYAQKLHGSRFSVRQFGFTPDTGCTRETFRIGDYDLNWDDYAELVGWWASEGYTRATKNKYCVLIYQDKKAHPVEFARIESLVRRLPFKWHYWKVKEDVRGIGISSRPLAEHLKSFGTHSQNKRLPRHVLDGPLSGRLRAFSAMMAGDGSEQITNTGPTSKYHSTSKGLSDDFQELCIRIGLGAVVRKCSPRKESNYLPAWVCGVALTRTDAQIDGNRNADGFYRKSYSGMVYCAEMRTGLLYVRRNGKPMLSGNSKGSGRSTGGYTQDEMPARSGDEKSKRLSMSDMNALLSHGALEVMRDGKALRGQRSLDYIAAFISGQALPEPKEPLVWQKFIESIRGAGVNPVRSGGRIRLMALTNNDVHQLAGDRELENAETVDPRKGLEPIRGGLFDTSLTGGHGGKRWSKITLAEPMPNPIMEDAMRKVLGVTQKHFDAVLEGREPLGEHGTGPKAIQNALASINLDREVPLLAKQWRTAGKTARDAIVKKWTLLSHAKDIGLHPKDWMIDSVPVLPPVFRPVSQMLSGKTLLVADPNLLYRHLFHANESAKSMHGRVEDLSEERRNLYGAMKAVVGIDEPQDRELQQKGVRGLLGHVFGNNSKFGMVQAKLLSGPADMTGRAVLRPNPELKIDEVELPAEQAWKMYRVATTRRLVQNGETPFRAAEMVQRKDPLAKKALEAEMQVRPVILTRAPILHRFNVLAFRPRLSEHDTVSMPPLVYKGFGADNDGDALSFHVPLSDKAVSEAYEKMLPSKNLTSVRNFGPQMVPSNEFVAGLYDLSTAQDDAPAMTFRNAQDAIQAWKRGEIPAGRRVDIVHHD